MLQKQSLTRLFRERERTRCIHRLQLSRGEMGNCCDKPATTSRSISTTTATTSHGLTITPATTSQSLSTAIQSSQEASKNNSNDGKFYGGDGGLPSSIDEAFPEGRILPTHNLKTFTFSELKTATRSFRADTVLGEGGFGRVFKGWVDEKTLAPAKAGSGMIVAVKKLDSESMQGLEEWQSEVNFLGRLSHPNLVKLLGYCWEDKELLLVYEYMPRGSLENHLFRKGTAAEPLSWSMRLKIAIDAAKGLAFLHTSEKKVIYRDFKASNILLDTNYNAKISDFGLAKNGPMGGDSHITTRVMGTYGYAAPEYVATGHLYVKSDVYGFGVVLLEMLSGQRALDTNRPSGQHNLVEWSRPFLSDRKKLTTKVMDQRIEGQYPAKGALQAGQLTLKCLEPDPRNRPDMKQVLEILEQIQAIKDKPRPSKTSTTHPHHNQGHHRQPIHPKVVGARGRAQQLSPKRSR